MIYGYIRVSTEKQDVDKQRLEVLDYCNDKGDKVDSFFEVKVSSTKSTKDRLIDDMLEALQDGDKLVVVELSRLGRSLIDVLQVIQKINDKGVQIEFIRQPFLNTSNDNPMQQALLSIFATFADIERQFIVMRTKAGLDKARLSKKLGRPKGSVSHSKLDIHLLEIKSLVESEVPIRSIARIHKVAESTLRRWAKNRNISLHSKASIERKIQRQLNKQRKL